MFKEIKDGSRENYVKKRKKETQADHEKVHDDLGRTAFPD